MKNNNTLNIGPKCEGLAYRFVQWQNHLSNIQEIKNLLDKANKTENELHFTLSEITLILQNYTTVKIQVDWVTSDKAVISWEDKINKHKTIPVEYFLEAIKTVRPDRDKLTKNDLRKLFRQRNKINKTIKRLIMKNNLNNEESNFKSFNYELKHREIDKQKKELYRNLKKDNFLQESDIFDGIKITDKKNGTQYTFKIEETLLEKEGE